MRRVSNQHSTYIIKLLYVAMLVLISAVRDVGVFWTVFSVSTTVQNKSAKYFESRIYSVFLFEAYKK